MQQYDYIVDAEKYVDARPEYPDTLFVALKNLVPQGGSVWEAACGSGQATAQLARYFDRVFATDAAENQIKKAPQLSNVSFYSEHAEQCSLPSESVDLTFIAQGLHWLNRQSYFDQALRVLKPGGILAYAFYQNITEDSPHATLLNRATSRVFKQFTPGEWSSSYYKPDFVINAPVVGFFDHTMTVDWTLLQVSDYLDTRADYTTCLKTTGENKAIPLIRQLAMLWPDPLSPKSFSWQVKLAAYQKPDTT